MDKLIGIILMVIFGVSGLGATAVAWLLPWLNLNKTEATAAGLIGMGFLVYQVIRFRHSRHNEKDQVSIEGQVEDKI
jgi:hypothetical protein